MKEAVAVKDISHTFAGNTGAMVLSGVNFVVPAGEIFGLLGPSGAGKTTLIKILTGRLKQTGGNAELFGKDTRELSAVEHGKIGIMMDDFGLYERLSVYDNLAFYADISRTPKNRIDGILEKIGLDGARKKPVQTLSKGMRSRLSLARALMNDVKLLFLDEPTAGLDPATAREIHVLLGEERKKGMTIFLTTHNMFEAQSLCDHVALLSAGKIMEYGEPGEICRKYNGLNQLRVTLSGGEEFSLQNDPTAIPLLTEALKKGTLKSIHSTEPTLEMVFIQLTGRGLS